MVPALRCRALPSRQALEMELLAVFGRLDIVSSPPTNHKKGYPVIVKIP
jgi:hypothetical protein